MQNIIKINKPSSIKIFKYLFFLFVLSADMIVLANTKVGQIQKDNIHRRNDTVNADIANNKIGKISSNIYHVSVKISEAVTSKNKRLHLLSFIQLEKLYNDLRTSVLNFWEKYPNDKRKYRWFQECVGAEANSLFYWKNIDSSSAVYLRRKSYWEPYNAEIDWTNLREWENKYPKMRNEFLNYSKDDSAALETKLRIILQGDIHRFFKLSMNIQYRKNPEKIDLGRVKELLLESGYKIRNGLPDSLVDEGEYRTMIYAIRTMAFGFLQGYDELGITLNELDNFFIEIEKETVTKNKGLYTWANQCRNLISYRNKPMDLKFTNPDGRLVDISALRGKVILLDFWTLTCSTCIGRMPYLKELFKKYNNDGFEVISLCGENFDQIDKIRKVEEKINAGWIAYCIGMDNLKKIWNQWGFFTVPQLLLLDRNGKLVLYNNTLMEGDFEPLLISLLKRRIATR